MTVTYLYRAAIAAVALFASAAPAGAAVIVAPNTLSATFTTNEAGSFFVETIGNMGDPGTDLVGLRGLLQFELIGGFNTSVLTFRYTLQNTSYANNLGSSIAVFGFNVAPDATLKVLSGTFDLGSKGNFSGLGKREFCIYDGSNCNGGANEGVFVNTPTNVAAGRMVKAVGTFSLTYGNPAPKAITFSDFATRWQRVGINQQQSASGTGSVVPEPETWAMMIAGFGLIGGAMRARRRRELALA
jgi:hypothetical protein